MSRLNIAKEEFDIESDDGKHKLVYAYFGLAIYQAQCLEETFSLMLWTDKVIKKNAKSNEEVNEIIDTIENSKKTMGNFINEVKESYNIAESTIAKLKEILNTRNYLTHKYFKIHIDKFYSDTGKLEMIKYFCDFVDSSTFIDEELKIYYANNMQKLGITETQIEWAMNEMKSQELRRVNE